MKKNLRNFFYVTAALVALFSFIACGGGGSDSVTYGGSTGSAVADSTTAAVLAEYSMGMIEAGGPLVMPFVFPPPGIQQTSISAQPLGPIATTTVVIPVPEEAIYYGADYGEDGTGSARILGTMTLYLSAVSAEADTWEIDEGELDGSIVFDGFRPDDGPTLTGTVTVSYGAFYFTGEALFSMSLNGIPDDPGFVAWTEVDLTFSELTASEGGDSWSLGEGDWHMEIGEGTVDLDINSMTVEYEGSTYKLEDTNVFVEMGESETGISLAGTTYELGAFYHHDLGKIWFYGETLETDPPDDIVSGTLEFYDEPVSGDLLFDVEFEYDDSEGATAYRIRVFDESYTEYGYYVDGAFIPDPSAMSNFT